ncbi:hypothetical protein BDA96_01G404700 [Sorghum bicolor]|uniref:Uncharacterized protein n=2 Tax=Sorghum bicolor TaxID=4558 RepID=A0A921S4H7_SORBI|nr:hypothetical protein BDA96_01G404700 [Sorghum bicolor]KXG39423.1 hypothetical protein SORBI_3001G380300 [Sorghum bicolor]
MHHACIKGILARVGTRNREDEACRMENEKGMEQSRQMMRGREPNKTEMHRTVLDDHLDGPSRTTNHTLKIFGRLGRCWLRLL